MSILAISGKKGSGKDTTGQIIQYLSFLKHYPNTSWEEYWKNKPFGYTGDWQIKKFADKLKDIICLLINCTREQLEDESFKSKELGEEWWYWYMKLDGGYSPIILDYLTTTKKELKSYEGLELVKPTPRFLLQFIGTNLLRNQLHPEIWVNILMSEYKPIDKRTWQDPDDSNINYPNWIITDMRFLNEMEAVKKRGGITIRVNRPCEICGGSGYHKISCLISKSGEHYSEIALDKSEFDHVIDNNSDVESLIEKVKEILIKEKLI